VKSDANECRISPLESGRSYLVRVYPYEDAEGRIRQVPTAKAPRAVLVRVGKKSEVLSPPEGLTVVADGSRVRLAWKPATERDVAGYEIMRRGESEDAFSAVGELRIDLIQPSAKPAGRQAGWSAFIDSVEENKKYEYSVRSFTGGASRKYSADSGSAWVLAVRHKASVDDVLILVNSRVPAARQIALKYARERGIKSPLIARVDVHASDEISRADFEKKIMAPVRELLAKHAKVTVIAIVRGVPWRILESGDSINQIRYAGWDRASVDSELALARLDDFPRDGRIANPFFGKSAKLSPVDGILGVCRLDAPTDLLAAELVSRAIGAERAGVRGVAFFDMRDVKDVNYKKGDEAIGRAAEMMRNDGRLVVKTDTKPEVVDISMLSENIAFYYGWYSEHWKPKNKMFRFARGAVAAHLHSYAGNVISANSNWVGEFLEHGATAAVGVAWEPLLDGFPQPDALVDALLKGCNLAEASLSANRYLSWMTITCGDPLYTPFSAGK